jgi:hypothetical protein
MFYILYLLWLLDKSSFGKFLALALWSFQTGAVAMCVFIHKLADRSFSNEAETYWKKSIQQTVAYDEDFIRKHQTGSVAQAGRKAL